MIYPIYMTFVYWPIGERKAWWTPNSRVAICRGLEMLWRVLDTVEELLEVVVPHLNRHVSHPQRCSPFQNLVCMPLSWKTSLPRQPLARPLLMTFCSSRTTGRVQQLSRWHWKAGIDPELDQCRTGLPLQTPIPAPRSSHGRSDLNLWHLKKFSLNNLRNTHWESEKYSWTLFKRPSLPPLDFSHGLTSLQWDKRERERQLN